MVKKTTIRDVANHCGVSVYTVSSVLNNKGDISVETTEKILSAVDQLNYNPLKNIAVSKTILQKTIALVFPDIYNRTDEFYFRAIQKALEEVARFDFDCKIFTESQFQEHMAVDSLRSAHLGIDGTIFFCTHQQQDALFERLINRNIQVVLIRRESSVPGVISIMDNEYQGTWDLMTYLHDCGHNKIGVVYDSASDFKRTKRYQAYYDFQKEQELQHNITEIFLDENFKENLLQQVQEKRVTALFCFQDQIAVQVMKTLMIAGIRIPHDISVAGYNCDPISRNFFPEITSVKVPVEEMIAQACQTLCKPNLKRNRKKNYVFDSELVKQMSSASLKQK
ncbi:MAG: LacI family transcriptional regulator [Lentisphaeria bacterium]|nr:LacI family transcriptional regulator [Lentisphaeria bacterium]